MSFNFFCKTALDAEPKHIEYQLSQHGDKRRWTTIRDVLSTHQRNTIILRRLQENNIPTHGLIVTCHLGSSGNL